MFLFLGVGLYHNYQKIIRITIPAVRAAVSIDLSKNHSMSETEIARSLGIAQAAVSKYVHRNYSNDIDAIVKFIEARKMQRGVVTAILSKKGKNYIINKIDEAASNKNLMKMVLSSN